MFSSSHPISFSMSNDGFPFMDKTAEASGRPLTLKCRVQESVRLHDRVLKHIYKFKCYFIYQNTANSCVLSSGRCTEPSAVQSLALTSKILNDKLFETYHDKTVGTSVGSFLIVHDEKYMN
jgi:hypothetical protein